jgi:hypothetical protein
MISTCHMKTITKATQSRRLRLAGSTYLVDVPNMVVTYKQLNDRRSVFIDKYS